MNYLFLLISFTLFIPESFQYQKYQKSYIPFNIDRGNLSGQNLDLYASLITGNKRHLLQEDKNQFKRYGLLHLLTPSGLHLSSLFFINLLPRYFCFLILSLVLIYISQLNAYLSLERVVFFRLIGLAWKGQLILKILCLLFFCFITKNYSYSPFSFAFSLLFWGTIIIFRKNKLLLIFFLFISLNYSAALTGQEIKFSSLIINPLVTSFFTFIFPLLFFNYLAGGITLLNSLINLILDLQRVFFRFIDIADFTPMMIISPFIIILILICISKNAIKHLVIILCLQIPNLQNANKFNNSKKILNIYDKKKAINQKKSRYFYGDRSCKVENFGVRCKKKPSKRRVYN